MSTSDECCTVCDSPTAKSFHFGAKACKACAAFFRRAVALNVEYNCKSGAHCTVHYEKRFICKKCRFDKCIEVGMKRHLVQPRRRLDTPEEHSPGLEYDTQCPLTAMPSSSSSFSSSEYDDSYVITTYTKAEYAMNDRRRMTYTNTRLRNLFGQKVQVPYQRGDLRLFDVQAYNGCSRAEFALTLDYIKAFPEFEKLTMTDQTILFRCACCVDYIMNTAYYSHILGFQEKILVNSDCTYYPIDPPPLTGNEPNAHLYFKNRDEFEKYKSLVPPMVENWHQIVVPMNHLNPSFEEFCLLKALTCWHMTYYKMSDGRKVCERQRNVIVKALFAIAKTRADDTVVERVGELLLFMSSALEQGYAMVSRLRMLTFFEIMAGDSMLNELLQPPEVLPGISPVPCVVPF